MLYNNSLALNNLSFDLSPRENNAARTGRLSTGKTLFVLPRNSAEGLDISTAWACGGFLLDPRGVTISLRNAVGFQDRT